MRLQRNTDAAACGASCVAAFPLAVVQGFATTAAAEWGDDDLVEEDTRSAGKKIVDAIKVCGRMEWVAIDGVSRWYPKNGVLNARPI